jgi:hypothetical protein
VHVPSHGAGGVWSGELFKGVMGLPVASCATHMGGSIVGEHLSFDGRRGWSSLLQSACAIHGEWVCYP